jgi:hypothetical protein
LGDAPGAAGFEEATAFKSGNEASADERGFAGTGETKDGNEAIAGETVTEVEDLLVAAEEEMGFAGFEGPEARVGVVESGEALKDGGEGHGVTSGEGALGAQRKRGDTLKCL